MLRHGSQSFGTHREEFEPEQPETIQKSDHGSMEISYLKRACVKGAVKALTHVRLELAKFFTQSQGAAVVLCATSYATRPRARFGSKRYANMHRQFKEVYPNLRGYHVLN